MAHCEWLWNGQSSPGTRGKERLCHVDPFAEDSYYVYLSDMVSVSAETILPTFDPRTSFTVGVSRVIGSLHTKSSLPSLKLLLRLRVIISYLSSL